MGIPALSGVFPERVPLRNVPQKGSNLLCIERKEFGKGTDKGEKYKRRLKRKFGAFRGGGIFLIRSEGIFSNGSVLEIFSNFSKNVLFLFYSKNWKFFPVFYQPAANTDVKMEIVFCKKCKSADSTKCIIMQKNV